MKIIAALVIGFYVILAIGIFVHLVLQRRQEKRNHRKDTFLR